MATEELDAIIGVDAHRDTHSAALTRPSGAVVATTVIETSGAGYRRCWTSPWTMPPDLGWSGRWRALAATGSGLTRFLHSTDRWWSRSTTPGGRLLAAGHPVVPVNPSAFHAARPR
jgi:hypothetical protein